MYDLCFSKSRKMHPNSVAVTRFAASERTQDAQCSSTTWDVASSASLRAYASDALRAVLLQATDIARITSVYRPTCSRACVTNNIEMMAGSHLASRASLCTRSVSVTAPRPCPVGSAHQQRAPWLSTRRLPTQSPP